MCWNPSGNWCFPDFRGQNLRSEYIEYYVGELVEDIKYHLSKQMMKAYLCCEPSSCSFAEAIELEVGSKCDEFLSRIGKIGDISRRTFEAAYDGDPAAYSMEEIITPIRESTPSPFTGCP